MTEIGVTQAPLAGLVAVAEVADLPAGWVLRVVASGREIALANRDGEFFAMDNACTHAGGPLAHNRLGADCTLECPWHNSLFDVRTGEVVAGPARKPARTYPVQVRDGRVYVSVAGIRPAVPAAEPPAGAEFDG
ncbi:MAG TPA: non-heme iron oxygenase ferredoxin subunit [Actinomycetota bacterium]|nr:non-heme iron oxygenase ferredoxin subunit [Actinomycetota bacterium]